jgi:hypothetical protein
MPGRGEFTPCHFVVRVQKRKDLITGIHKISLNINSEHVSLRIFFTCHMGTPELRFEIDFMIFRPLSELGAPKRVKYFLFDKFSFSHTKRAFI